MAALQRQTTPSGTQTGQSGPTRGSAGPKALAEFPHTSLPASALWTGDRRFESATYLTGGYAIRRAIETSGLPVVPLDDMAEVWQPSRLKGIGVRPEHGVPFLTATQVFDIRPMPRKWLAPGRTENLEERYLERGWILVTCSGNVGDVILSYAPHEGMVVSHDLLRVQVREAKHLGYVYAFLRSRHGRLMLRSSQYGSIINHLEPEHLHTIPVPVPSDEAALQASAQLQEIFAKRDEAYRLVVEAEGLFTTAIGAAPPALADERGYEVPAAELFARGRRLDGFHHNPAAEAALHAIEDSGREYAPLGDVTRGVFGVPRFKHIYTTSGTPYVDSEDIFKINPELTKFIPPGAKKDAAKYFVKRGWLLMASSGQLYGLNGGVVLANEWHEGKILSNHIIRIEPDDIRPGYLQMALGHPVYGRPLVQRLAFGTEVPEIAPTDLLTFPVVRLSPAQEVEIAIRVERASTLRQDAELLEDRLTAETEAFLSDVAPLSELEMTAAAAAADEAASVAEG